MSVSSRICQSCASRDRRLHSLDGLRSILQEINLTELMSIDGGMCWECTGLIQKFYKFKQRAQKTQSLLSNGDQLDDIICTSSYLGFKTNCDYDYLFEHNAHQLVVQINIKTEDAYFENNPAQGSDLNKDNSVNEEPSTTEKYYLKNFNIDVDVTNEKHFEYDIKHESDEDTFNSCDEIPLSKAKDLYENDIILKKSPNLKTKKKSHPKYTKATKDSNEVQKLNKKYLKIVFTEEEMVNKCDAKRNGHNYKVLPFKCESCVLGFRRKDYYDSHIEQKHNEKVGGHPCPVCTVRFKSEVALERHKKKHYICYKCCFCKYETTGIMAIIRHCKTKHENDESDSIHCTHCDVVFKTPEEITEHKLIEHPFYCDDCGDKFISIASLRSHRRRVHATNRKFPCSLCNKPFRTKQRLESHTASKHAGLAKKLSYCQVCKIQYKSIYVYRNHLRNSALHSGEAHQCTECGRKFASKVYLKKHYKFYHLQKSQHKCDQCSKIFISDFRLKNHKRTQHGMATSRDFHCNVCGKQFYTRKTLQGHQQLHSSERPYMCDYCGAAFRQRPGLYNHHRLVHKGEAYRHL